MKKDELSTTLAAELKTLSVEQRQALLKLLEKDGIDITRYQAIQPRAGSAKVPLSYQQQRLWFLAQLEESSSNYNIPLFLRIAGRLNVDALIGAVKAVVARHEVLRTRFISVAGQPEQVFDPIERFAVQVESLQHLHDLHRICSQEASREFDLSADMPLRARLLQHAPEENFFLVTFHHSVSDGWSLGIFFRELVASYAACCNDQRAPPRSLPIQYADYALWQREWLSGETLHRQVSYWERQLGGLPGLLELPTDRPRPAVKTYRGATQPLLYSPELLVGLNRLSQQQGITLYMALLAGFSVLFGRYTGLSDIAVGSPIANRNRPELEDLIGFFVNTLVMRTRLSPGLTFVDLLSQVKATTMDAYEHQDVPFEYLAEIIKPERSLSYSPFFQVMLVLQNLPVANLKLDGLELSMLEREHNVAKFDLTLSLHEAASGLQGSVEYNRDLFDDSTIARLVLHYQNILAEMVANPQGKVFAFDFLSNAEKRQLFVEWNDTSRDYPQDLTLHGLFARQASKTPDHFAVKSSDEWLTYRELYLRAKCVAYELQLRGAAAGDLIGIVIGKIGAQIVAVMGALFSGAAYLPIDTTWPMERQKAVLAAGKCRFVLSSDDFMPTDLPDDMQIMNVARLPQIDTSVLEAHSLPLVPATDLAYVIFTSGSTGKPKGVVIEHRSAVNTILDINNRFNVTSHDSVLALSSLAFDLSVYDLFGILAVGGTVVLPPDEERINPSAWWALVFEQGITLWDTVPAVFQMLVDFSELDEAVRRRAGECSLRLALLSGDWLPVELPRRAKEIMQPLEIISLGGATEASIWSNCYPIEDVSVVRRSIPYGKPLANQQFYILDDAMQPCPIGVPGNLHIGGMGLARGYWEDSKQTNDSFIQHETGRLYRTGDLGRWLADGNMEFLGRRDGQVKIHGFRIELGEIESQLSKHPAVQSCIVLMREDVSGDKRLVAYVVEEPLNVAHGGPLQTTLLGFLAQALPNYMVPSAIVFLKSLPLTPNGKIDRKALPVPDATSKVKEEYAAPRTETERKLVEIWQETLNIDRVGRDDNFFAAGGHSLNSVQVLKRVHQSFDSKITLRDIFRFPTIAELGAVIEGVRTPIRQLENPRLLRAGAARPLFFVHTVLGDTDHYVPLANLLVADASIYALHVSDRQAEDLKKMSMEELAMHHVEAVRKIQPAGPYRFAGHSTGGLTAYEIARQLQSAGEDIEFVGLIDTYQVSNDPDFEDVRGDLINVISFIIQRADASVSNAVLDGLRSDADGDEKLFFEKANDLHLIPAGYSFDDAVIAWRYYTALRPIAKHYFPQIANMKIHMLAATESLAKTSSLMWDARIARSWSMHEIAGNHATIMFPPNIRIVAEKISHLLGANR